MQLNSYEVTWMTFYLYLGFFSLIIIFQVLSILLVFLSSKKSAVILKKNQKLDQQQAELTEQFALLMQAVLKLIDGVEDSQKQNQLGLSQKDGINYHHATTLLQNGEDPERIMQKLHLSRDEIEILKSLVNKRKAVGPA